MPGHEEDGPNYLPYTIALLLFYVIGVISCIEHDKREHFRKRQGTPLEVTND